VKKISVAAATISLFAVTALSAAACGPDSSDASGTKPSPSASSVFPKEDLAKAMVALNSTSEKFTISQGGKPWATGAMDVPKKSGDIALTTVEDGLSIKVELLTVDPDTYVKYDFGTALNKQLKVDPKKFYKIDPTKVTDKDSITVIDPETADPFVLQDAIHAMSDVKTADGGATYTGTIVLDAAKNSIMVISDDLTTKYADKIKAVPFTAKVADGKLVSFKIDGTGIGNDVTTELTVTGFGTATVTKPATATAAPASIYEILNGS